MQGANLCLLLLKSEYWSDEARGEACRVRPGVMM